MDQSAAPVYGRGHLLSLDALPQLSSAPIHGKRALLALVRGVRRRYHRVRLQAQGIFGRLQGLALRYSGCVAEFEKTWECLSGATQFTFEPERICQIGSPLLVRQRRGLLELPDAGFGSGHFA